MILDDVKLSLRINNIAYDNEIIDLIETARNDLIISGVSSTKVNDDTDPLIKRAILTYCKANFGFDNPDFEKLNGSYESLKILLSLASDYKDVIV